MFTTLGQASYRTPNSACTFSEQVDTRPHAQRFDERYASDPGDYGQGEYWTDNRDFASSYGDVLERELDIDRVYHIPREELMRTIEEFGTCRMEDDRAKRIAAARLLTECFRSLGYDAVLTHGYETFGVYGLCILDAELPE